jgi:hypothetical protein
MNGDSVLNRLQTRPFIPIMVLLFFLLLLGWLNSDYYVLNGRPMILSDGQSAIAFYDSASTDSSSNVGFAFRESSDGKLWSREKRVSGRLLDAQLHDGHLQLLFPTFLSTYERDSFKRVKTVSLKDLPFQPIHLQSKNDSLLLLGLDKQQNLRAATYKKGSLTLIPSKLVEAGGLSAKKPRTVAKPSFAQPIPKIQEFTSQRKQSVRISSVPSQGALHVLLAIAPPSTSFPTSALTRSRLSPDRSTSTTRDISNGDPRRLRLAQLKDGAFIGDFIELKMKAVVASLFMEKSELRLMSVATKTSAEIVISRFVMDSKSFEKVEAIPFKRGGFMSNQGISSLSISHMSGTRLMLAQIGGSIRLHSHFEKSSDWRSMSRLSGEAKTLVYGWFIAVLLLALLLVLVGIQSFRQRQLTWPNVAGGATEADLQSIIERSQDRDIGDDDHKGPAGPVVDSRAVSDSSGHS